MWSTYVINWRCFLPYAKAQIATWTSYWLGIILFNSLRDFDAPKTMLEIVPCIIPLTFFLKPCSRLNMALICMSMHQRENKDMYILTMLDLKISHSHRLQSLPSSAITPPYCVCLQKKNEKNQWCQLQRKYHNVAWHVSLVATCFIEYISSCWATVIIFGVV